jgi:hypothetical protein
MYQPNLKEELIRKLHHEAKIKKTKMTKLLNQIVENHYNNSDILEEIEKSIMAQAEKTLCRK